MDPQATGAAEDKHGRFIIDDRGNDLYRRYARMFRRSSRQSLSATAEEVQTVAGFR